MPARLKKGGSRETVSANIKEIVDDWEKDGTIGTSRPRTKQQAVKQAVAISLGQARQTARGKAKPPPPPEGTPSAAKEKSRRRSAKS